MKLKLEKILHHRFIITILVLLFIVTVSFLGTYAMFVWKSTDNTKLTMTIGKLADVTFETGNKINTNLTPVFNYYDGEKTTFRINNASAESNLIEYTVKLNITTIPTELRNKGVKFSLVKNGVLIVTKDLSDGVDNSTIEIYSDALSNGVVSYEFYIYIDGNIENNSSMIGKTITGNIMVEASENTDEIQ